jgi:hypothetical protein
MKKLFTYLKNLFSAKASINVEVTPVVEKEFTPVVEKEVFESKTEEPTKEIEARLVEVSKEEKVVTAKEIKAKVKMTKP